MDKGRITGLGGVFFHSPDPGALGDWYRDTLGLAVEAWGGAALPTGSSDGPPAAVWAPFAPASAPMAPSERPFMVNFAVDDLDAVAERLAKRGVALIARNDDDDNGRFAWILDPDGTKIELWEPKRA